MSKTVSSSEAKNKFGSIVGWVLANEDEVIVESRGEPRVVILPFTEYEKIKGLKEQIRRREALARLESLRESVRARNQDLSEEQAEAVADRFSREIIEEMVEAGRIQFRG